jgi:glyoxylase-like metal-dependent hydrolase (beta-lactamase superfamily II)
LDAIGYGLSDVSDFLVTHAHRDHYSQAITIRRLFGNRVSLGEGERASIEWLTRPAPRGAFGPIALLIEAGAKQLHDELVAQPPADGGAASDTEPPDVWLDGADIALSSRTLRVIPTPGHTRGHVVFLDAGAGIMFAGDHVLPHITPSIGVESVGGSLPLADYLTSLQLMKTFPDVRLLPAHGPVAVSVHDRVDQLIEHHRVRLEETLAALTNSASTAFEVASLLSWTRRKRALSELDGFNKVLAIRETAAHLDVLVERGLVRSELDGEVRHYYA